ncbi:LAME_0F08152g1_1 [Lachancea meyersii CBS 8951]|uniref:Dolichyl-diphosphooligosaccharide--protein glycosyltransferase subunit WBP1 n=1 Tax=Lachancea meyersii CBS 8951 TaxID=1266667 RepID=A0A1G4JUM5_9SACH|nr:LAME_0F08152g1_1 [Lachancea meyersii CBS 8951]
MSQSLAMLKVLIFFVQLISLTQAKPSSGSRSLVIYDKRLTDLDDYSIFFSNLEERSYHLDYAPVSNGSAVVELFSGEEKLYDNLIVFPVKSRHFNKQLPAERLLDFFNDGGEILVMTSPNGVADNIRIFLNQLGIYPSPRNYELKDYFHVDDNGLVRLSGNDVLNQHVVPKSDQDVLYEGSAALLGSSDLIIPVLHAPRTSFTEDVQKQGDKWTVGSQGYVMASFQSLRNSRLTWVGSDSFFSNKYSAPNQQFAQELIKWTFDEKSVVKAVLSRHSHSNGLEYADSPYKIKDEVVYDIGLTEWNGASWVPFIADDIQFELRMVDPYYRITLKPKYSPSEVQMYTTGNFNLPDHHGIFTFIVGYKRSGLSFFTEKDVKAIRHLANDEYSRSWDITNSWVYLTAIYSVIIVWVVFVALFMGIKRKSLVPIEKKTN